MPYNFIGSYIITGKSYKAVFLYYILKINQKAVV
jgi:hypothetical protein